jgi:hypothetical protein
LTDENHTWQPPWTGGSRLFTVYDMNEYLAPRLTKLAREFLDVWSEFFAHDEEKEKTEPLETKRKRLRDWLVGVGVEAKVLGLPSVMRQAKRMYNECAGWDATQIRSALEELERRFDEETESLKLFYVAGDKIGSYSKTDLFGDEFKTNFPTANAEVIEAGNCLAFDRFSAVAFHLSRALEIAVRTIFVALGMPARVWSVTKWQKILQRIDGKIKKNNERLSSDPSWQRDRHFYEKAHAFLAAAANPMRNSTVHVDAAVVYPSEDSVRPVWLATEAFLRHIATKLSETPQKPMIYFPGREPSDADDDS